MKTELALRDVVIVDQCSGLTPAWLQANTITLNAVRKWARQQPTDWHGLPKVTQVPEDYAPRLCEVVIASGPDGRAFAWKMLLDSSG